jgi:hypothetical protein
MVNPSGGRDTEHRDGQPDREADRCGDLQRADHAPQARPDT